MRYYFSLFSNRVITVDDKTAHATMNAHAYRLKSLSDQSAVNGECGSSYK